MATAKKQLKQLNDDLDESFANVGAGFNDVNGRIDAWARQHRAFRAEFNELREELATNGVIRDLRKVEKIASGIIGQQKDLMEYVERRFSELDTNGVATAINKLNKEIFGAQKEQEQKEGYLMTSLMRHLSGGEYAAPAEATLAGKVDAIIEHLGIDVTIKPQEVIKAKVVAKKKAPAKKKGRR